MLNLYTGGLLVSPNCEQVIRGFTVDYKYRRLRGGGTTGAVYLPAPDKNDASHLMDAVQYAVLHVRRGDGEDEARTQQLAQRLSAQRRRLTQVV